MRDALVADVRRGRRVIRRAAATASAVLCLGAWPAFGGRQAAPLADRPPPAAPILGSVVAVENDYVVVRYVALEVTEPPARRDVPTPVVAYISVQPTPGVLTTQPWQVAGGRPSAAPALRGVEITLRRPPPAPPTLGVVGSELPRGTEELRRWEGGRLVRATFPPQRISGGTGAPASVTVFLTEGIVDLVSRGTRRRVGVAPGDAMWLDPATRIRVMTDTPVSAAVVQLWPGR